MNVIADKIEALRKFQSNIFRYIRTIVEMYDYVLIDMNIQDQLYEQGIYRTGTEIAAEEPYKPRTVKFKLMKRQPADRVTLRDEGDFHKSFTIEAGSHSFKIFATDIKTEMLTAKYGEEIFGLTDENLNEFIKEYIYPELKEFLLKELKS